MWPPETSRASSGNFGSAGAQRQTLGHVQADHQRTGQAGSLRHGNRVQVGQAQLRTRERLLDDRHNAQDVLARGDFREDATIARMDIHLRGDNRRTQRATILDDSGGSFVTG